MFPSVLWMCCMFLYKFGKFLAIHVLYFIWFRIIISFLCFEWVIYMFTYSFSHSFIFEVLGIKLTLYMLDIVSFTELQPQAIYIFISLIVSMTVNSLQSTICILRDKSHITQAGFELPIWLEMTLNSCSLQCQHYTRMYYHVPLMCYWGQTRGIVHARQTLLTELYSQLLCLF